MTDQTTEPFDAGLHADVLRDVRDSLSPVSAQTEREALDEVIAYLDRMSATPGPATVSEAEAYEPSWEELKAAKAAFVSAGNYALTIDALKAALIAARNAEQGGAE